MQSANDRMTEAEKTCGTKTRAAARSVTEAERLKVALLTQQEMAVAATNQAVAEHQDQLKVTAQVGAGVKSVWP